MVFKRRVSTWLGKDILYRVYVVVIVHVVCVCVCVCTWFCCLFAGSYVFVICFRRVRKMTKSNCELRLSPYETIRLPLDGFWWISYMSFYRKSVHKIEVPLKSVNNKGYFRRRLFTFVTISRWILFRMRSVWDSYPAHLRSKSLTMILFAPAGQFAGACVSVI